MTNITINILLLTVTNWIGIDGPNEVGLVRTNTVLEAVCEGQTNRFTLKTEDSFRYVLRPFRATNIISLYSESIPWNVVQAPGLPWHDGTIYITNWP